MSSSDLQKFHASVLMNFSDREVRNELKKKFIQVVAGLRHFFMNDELGMRMTAHFMKARAIRKDVFKRLVKTFAKYMKEIDVE